MADEAPDDETPYIAPAYDSDGFRNSGDDSSPGPRGSPFPDKTVEPAPTEVQPETPVVGDALTEAGLSPNPATQLAEIEGLMAEGDHGPYWKGAHADALQERYRQLLDRKSGASVPSRGSVLDAEISSIEAGMADGDYMRDLAEQSRYRTLLIARDADPPASALANGAANLGVDETGAAVSYGVVKQILDAMPDDVRGDIDASFEQLPEAVQVAIGREFAAYLPPVDDATPQQVEDFGTHEAGEILIHEWADSAPLNVAIVKARWQSVRDGLDDNGRGWMDWYIDEALQPHEAAAVLRVLAA